MIHKRKNRRFVQYSLLVCVILIQLIILVFFYNTYFNGNKLEEIEEKLENVQQVRYLTNQSKKGLIVAQKNLNLYFNQHDKKFLEKYFKALQQSVANIDTIDLIDTTFVIADSVFMKKNKDIIDASRLSYIIDSIYRRQPGYIPRRAPLKLDTFKIKGLPKTQQVEVKVRHVEDSVPKKGFFARLKDAFNSEVEVKTDTIYITKKFGISVDTGKIKSSFDKTINKINTHYITLINQYQQHLSEIQRQNVKNYHIYGHLVSLSNELMTVYGKTIDTFSEQLRQEYKKQKSINTQIQKSLILGLMVLLFFVLFILMYYTRMSFYYEQKIEEANALIKGNLNFKNKILGMLSHEIRAPLKMMSMFIRRIAVRTKDKQITEYLKTMRFTNHSLLLQANQILEYTKNKGRALHLKPTRFNLSKEIDILVKAFQPYIESKDNKCILKNTIDKELDVETDKAKIHQLFNNIIGNANKFTENGEICITVSTVSTQKESIRLEAKISDTGSGVSTSDLEKIFAPYQQGKLTNEFDNIGVGLGLSLCKELVELFNGMIKAESESNKGTTIIFTLLLKTGK